MNVISAISVIAEKMDKYIQPHADTLMTHLPLVWEESEEHDMLRRTVISALTQIVISLRVISPRFSFFLYSVIKISTDVKQPSHVYLMEEALRLWLFVVENSIRISQHLLDLCKSLPSIIEISSEHLHAVLAVIQAYILRSPEEFLQQYGVNFVSTCANMLTDMRSESILFVMKLFETYLQAEPNVGLELLKPVLPYIFKQVYESKKNRRDIEKHLVVIARVVIINQDVFIEATQQMNERDPLQTILDVWISIMPFVFREDRKKLMGLALGSLLTVNNNIVYERFGGILKNICISLNDIMEEDEEERSYDTLYLADEDQFDTRRMDFVWDLQDFLCRSKHYELITQWYLKDPVHGINLKDYIQSQIAALRQSQGQLRFDALMRTVDNGVLSNLTYFWIYFLNYQKQMNNCFLLYIREIVLFK